MIRLCLFLLLVFSYCINLYSQGESYPKPYPSYWQQLVDYKMEIDFDLKKYQYTGDQVLKYTNHSPDTLKNVYYHLFFNAFKPGSEMDLRSKNIPDPSKKIGDRISKLQPHEIGYLNVLSLTQDGVPLKYKTVETILEVPLNKTLKPGETTTLSMRFEGQVPLQIRRSGRNSKEGVALSMTQWYPKMAAYDFEGWHANPYIAREFHGNWGDFDVKIKIDKRYIVGGSGYLQNNEPDRQKSYKSKKRRRGKPKKRSWHFIAPRVHDFAWAADPEYVHDTLQMANGVLLQFYYKNNPKIRDNWKKLQQKTAEAMTFLEKNIGPYPYKQYSVLQGGDGGMEYAMCTLITGERKFESLVGVTVHELAHSWFQHILASNESKNEWMDEGFTTYISTLCMNEIMNKNATDIFDKTYESYFKIARSGIEQPLTTHADRYLLNQSYKIAAYDKGALFLTQLGYIIGEENLKKTLKRYYHDFKFTHPTPNDIKRVAEKVSGIHLDWYLTDWAKTTNTIDYGIQNVSETPDGLKITLKRIGLMPMPIDIKITYADGNSQVFYIPLRLMRGSKPTEKQNRVDLPAWAWSAPSYSFTINSKGDKIDEIIIDPSGLMADIDSANNWLEIN